MSQKPKPSQLKSTAPVQNEAEFYDNTSQPINTTNQNSVVDQSMTNYISTTSQQTAPTTSQHKLGHYAPSNNQAASITKQSTNRNNSKSSRNPRGHNTSSDSMEINRVKNSPIRSGGTKNDYGKTMYHLVDNNTFTGIADAMTYGAGKYTENNWKKGIKFSRLYNAHMRHLSAFIQGDIIDEESGLPHLYHASANLMMLNWMYNNKPEHNDMFGQQQPDNETIFHVDSDLLESLLTTLPHT